MLVDRSSGTGTPPNTASPFSDASTLVNGMRSLAAAFPALRGETLIGTTVPDAAASAAEAASAAGT